MYVLTALTGRNGRLRHLHYWLAVFVFALVNGAAYRIGVEMLTNEQWGLIIALMAFLLMVMWLWAAAVARSRDMGAPS